MDTSNPGSLMAWSIFNLIFILAGLALVIYLAVLVIRRLKS